MHKALKIQKVRFSKHSFQVFEKVNIFESKHKVQTIYQIIVREAAEMRCYFYLSNKYSILGGFVVTVWGDIGLYIGFPLVKRSDLKKMT